jgi:hypothetical protein
MLAHFEITLNDPNWAVFAGLLVGFVHVYMGADHLAAVMPMSVNRRFKAAWVGVRWGIGHSLGVLVVAIALLAGREVTGLTPDADWVDTWGKILVGVLLLALGVWGFRQARVNTLHVHRHSHEDAEGEHAHLHVHKGGAEPHSHGAAHVHSHAAYAVGTLHGMAGLAHVAAVLPSLVAPSAAASLGYLGGFMLGTVLGLGLFAGVFGVVTAKLGDRSPKFVKGSMYFAAAACVVIGIGLIVLPLFGIDLFHHDH